MQSTLADHLQGVVPPPAVPVDLKRTLAPKSVAIVGISAGGRSLGSAVLDNLQRAGYADELYLVSRSSDEIDGRPCLRSLEDIPEGVDVVVLAIPEAGVLDAVRTCAERKAGGVVVFASGYAEVDDEGRVKQEALARCAAENGIPVIGPNCMGYTNFVTKVSTTFEPQIPPVELRSGVGVGVVAQSGAMAANLRDSLLSRFVSTSVVASTGNEAHVSVEDYIAYMLEDPATSVVAVYAEQIRRPALFLQLADQARSAGKPIVLLMPGKSARAREAAQSHTGALAGDYASASALLKGKGVVLVQSLDEFCDVTAVLARFPKPAKRGPAIITGSGAVKSISLDFADDVGLDLPLLQPETVAQLTAMLPSYATPENPLDYTTISIGNHTIVGELIDVLAADANVGSVVLTMVSGIPSSQRTKADHMLPALARANKPAVAVMLGDSAELVPYFYEVVESSGVPLFRSLDRALTALARVSEYGEALERAARTQSTSATSIPLPSPAPPSGVFAEYQGKHWLVKCGVRVPTGRLAKSVDDAVDIAHEVGYPVVIKAQASELPHKSDVGGVVVGLADESALRAGWRRLLDNVRGHRPDLELDGVLVEAMGQRGLELVVGARRDPEWGPVVLVGLGGVWIEALHDVRLIPAGTALEDIKVELTRLKGAALLQGLRGAPAVDVEAVARVVATIGAQMQANPQISEIDINPLVAYPQGVLALDALVVCTPNAAE